MRKSERGRVAESGRVRDRREAGKDLTPAQKICTWQTILFMPPIPMANNWRSTSTECNTLRFDTVQAALQAH